MTKSRSRRPRAPTYQRHRRSGQACVYLRQEGNRRCIYLGEFDSPASHREYRRVLAEFFAGEKVASRTRAAAAPPSSEYPTVAALCARFLLHAEVYYRRPDGSVTGEVVNFTCALRPLLKLHRDTSTDGFGVTELEALRDEMIDCGWSRTYVNSSVARIRRVFRWGETKQLTPAGSWAKLRALPGLERGRSEARERERRGPVDVAIVERTLPFLPRQLAAMALLQLSTGMRPGEACAMSMDQIDRGNDDDWIYRPTQHKNSHRGQPRPIPLLAEEQDLLRPFLRADGLPLFSPKEAEAERHASRRDARQTPMTPSQAARRPKAKPKRAPSDQYDTRAYAHAVRRACRLAGVPGWSPNQLRKRAATDANAVLHNRDAVRTLLGHSDDRSLVHYVEEDATLAISVRRQLARVRFDTNSHASNGTQRETDSEGAGAAAEALRQPPTVPEADDAQHATRRGA